MHKIKKGIKKKIKGKKGKNDNELFTEEEYENYKKQKEEEAKAHLEEELEGATTAAAEDHQLEDEAKQEEQALAYATSSIEPPSAEETAATAHSDSEDWKSFFSATDTVLKETSVNLEHIKEVSYFQKNVKKPDEVANGVENVAPAATLQSSEEATLATKGWVDLDKGGFDDDSVGEDEYEQAQRLAQEASEENQEESTEFQEVELKPLELEDLPTAAAEDYADIFDTTYVDNVESGEVQLFEIPDSPTEDTDDPFDTSDVDKILNVKKKEPKKPKKAKKQKEPEKPIKKKKLNLVNLGCAVDVLTGKTSEPTEANIRKKVVEQEVNLLADFEDNTVEVTNQVDNSVEACKQSEGDIQENTEEKCVVDDILFGSGPDCDLPDLIQIPPTVKSDQESDNTNLEDKNEDFISNTENKVNLTEELAELLDPLASLGSCVETSTESHLKDLVAEFDVIDKEDIKDEFDAEFAELAAESLAKEKEKDEDDPFDTSAVNHLLGESKNNTLEEDQDPFDTEFANQVSVGENSDKKSAPPRPALPQNTFKESEDPFDTSAVDSFCTAADPFDNVETDHCLPETLKPESGPTLTKSDSFDPFDTSAADCFGITELKVLEGEFLKDIPNNNEADFDFNPREGEIETQVVTCLLTESEELSLDQPALTPQTITSEEEEPDPFDTSIAEKVELQSLEELLNKGETHLKIGENHKNPPPRPISPACILSLLNNTETSTAVISSISKVALAEDFDPFDTTIADQFVGASETNSHNIEKEVKEHNTLNLDLKPPRPVSPLCLLATTPIDENPTLEPITKGVDVISKAKEEEEIDPFDTSIADQFGKTELKALEFELLTKPPVEVDDDFDPRALESEILETSQPTLPSFKPASPTCLLTGTSPEVEQSLPPLSPIETTLNTTLVQDFDPFDTSIANTFGKVEIKNLENELLSDLKSYNSTYLNLEENQVIKPENLQPDKQCIFELSSTDSNLPLQPTFLPNNNAEPTDEIDPFDTSIAEQFGKTELKVLEQTLLTSEACSIPSETINPKPIIEQRSTNLEVKDTDSFFDISPSADSLPVLQPSQLQPTTSKSPDIDPFDTSIADKFGTTELRALENQLLIDSGTKRGLSDDEFDPREEEAVKKRSQSPISINPNILDSHIDFPEQSLAVLEANAVISIVEDDFDPFDTSIADGLGKPSKIELTILDKELLGNK